jgi:hypothetical protein
MAQQKPLDIQPLDIQPVEGGLDIQPLDIQPLPSVTAKPYRKLDRPVADVFNTGIVPPEKQPLLPYDPRKIHYPQPLKPAAQPPREKSPLEIGRQQSEATGREFLQTPILSVKPDIHREIEEISKQYPALGYTLGLGTRFAESITSPVGIGTAAAAFNPVTGPAVWGLGAASTGHGFYEAFKNWEDKEKSQAGLEEALLGSLGLRFGHFGERPTSPTPPKPEIKGTDPTPPSGFPDKFTQYETTTGTSPSFEGVPSPEGVKPYFPNLAARVAPRTATTTGKPAELMVGGITAEPPVQQGIGKVSSTGGFLPAEVPTVPTPERTTTGKPSELITGKITTEPPTQQGLGAVSTTGGWNQIEVPADLAVTPKEVAPTMNRKARFLELVQKFEMTGELGEAEFAELSELRKDPEMMRGRSKPFQDVIKRLFTEEAGSMPIDPTEWLRNIGYWRQWITDLKPKGIPEFDTVLSRAKELLRTGLMAVPDQVEFRKIIDQLQEADFATTSDFDAYVAETQGRIDPSRPQPQIERISNERWLEERYQELLAKGNDITPAEYLEIQDLVREMDTPGIDQQPGPTEQAWIDSQKVEPGPLVHPDDAGLFTHPEDRMLDWERTVEQNPDATADYQLPDGRIVKIREDVARGEKTIDFELPGKPATKPGEWGTRGEIVKVKRINPNQPPIEGPREQFGGEEPPDTAPDYKRNQTLLKSYTDYVKSLTPEDRRQRILAGEKLPDFSKTSGRQGQTKNRKVWVDNLTLDSKGNRIGGYVSESDLVNLADRWNKFTKVTRREPINEPPTGPASFTEEPELTSADYERLKNERDAELLKNEVPGAKNQITREPEQRFLSQMTNEERAAEIKKLIPYEEAGSLTAGERMKLNQLRAMNRLTHDAQGNPLAEPGYAPGKADTVEEIANRLKSEPAKAEPAVEPITETPKLKEAAKARKAKEQPIEKKPIQQVSSQANLLIGTFKQFISELPDTLGKHVTRLKDHILGDKPIKPVDGWDSLKGDLRSIRDDPNTPFPISQKIMSSWKDIESALTTLYTEESGSLEFGKLWENIRRRKEEGELPKGWSAPGGAGGRVSLPKRVVPTRKGSVSINRFGSDIDLGPKPPQNVPNWLRQAQRGWSTTRNLQSVDITPLTSATFRQALSEVGTVPWLKGLYNSFRAFGSENFDRGIYERIMRDPVAQPRRIGTDKQGNPIYKPSLLKEAGVKFSGLGNYSAMEEMIRGDLSEKIPIYGRWVKASNRAYSAMLNTTRFEKFKKLEKAFGSRDNVPELKRLGELINNTTGQGGLGRIGDRYAELAGELFYAPKFTASRFHLMRNLVNPKLWYQHPKIARQYLYSALRLASAWVGMAELGAQFIPGAEVSHDPTNPDFMKLKINGKVRMDFSGGVQPIMVLMGKLLSGQTTSSLSGETRELNTETGPYAPTQYGEIARFGYNKLHPNIRMIIDFLARTPDNKFHVPDRAIQQVAPMALGDVIQAIQDGEFENLFPAALGAPVQSYEKGDEFNEPRFWPPQGREDLDFTLPREQSRFR